MEFKDIVKERYACKKFDGKKIPENKIKELLEIIRMAPSSFGLQPYKILVITNQELKKKLRKASWNQQQITTCSHLLVFCADKDVLRRIKELPEIMKKAGYSEEAIKHRVDYIMDSYGDRDETFFEPYAKNQTFIALGNAVNGAKSLGFDSCPMGGFVAEEYSKILNLTNNLIPTVLCPIGYAADEQKPKVRYDDLFEFLK